MATAEQFSLRWNNFHSNLSSGFHELFEANEMVDVTLAVDGKFLQAHKLVLSICSPYFKQMFKANPCKHPIVIIKDVQHKHMKDILEFMYMGEVSVLRENLTTFLRTAELLQVKGLTGDDSSETSSKNGEQGPLDGDNDDESEDFSHLIESNLNVDFPRDFPTHFQPNTPSKNQTKRQTKNAHLASNKRPKTIDNNANQTSEPTNSKCEEQFSTKIEETDDYNDIVKMEKNPPEEELSEAAKLFMEKTGGFPSANADSFTDQDMLMFATESKPYVFCPYCERKFVNRYNLKVHIRDKHEDNSFNLDCSVCGKTMRNRSCLRVHMYHHRKQQIEQIETSVSDQVN